tara:strand:- start:151 stop:423 length:273 start_codon:yes stop_codon:yes gene_type:complete
MTKRLIQYGGYVISGFLIAWLINPAISILLLKIILKMIVFVGFPVTGLKILDRVIALKSELIWKVSIIIWITVSIVSSFWLMKLIDKLFS